jgi:hypothetical protein
MRWLAIGLLSTLTMDTSRTLRLRLSGPTSGNFALLAGRAAGNLPLRALYGLATCAFAWLLMLPAMGYGAFGLRFSGTPLRSTALYHLVFGLAVALWWRIFDR